MVWGAGLPSTIFECQAGHKLDFGGTNMGVEIHRYFGLTAKESATTVLYGFSVHGGELPAAAKAKERADMGSVLHKLGRVAGLARYGGQPVATAQPLKL